MVKILPAFECENRIVDICVEELNNDKLIVLPTETVYGITIKINSKNIESLYRIKGRHERFTIHISHIDDLKNFGIIIKDKYVDIIENITPNPITLIVEDINNNKIGIRVPDIELTRDILSRVGPCYMPSANLKDNPSPTNIYHVIEDLSEYVDLIVDYGEARYGIDSTVIDLTKTPHKVLRIGAFTPDKLREYFNNIEIDERILKMKPLDKKYLKNIEVYGFKNIDKVFRILDKYERCIIVCTLETYYNNVEKFRGNVDFYILGSIENPLTLYRNVYPSFRYIMKKSPDKVFLELLPVEDVFLPVIEKFLNAVNYILE